MEDDLRTLTLGLTRRQPANVSLLAEIAVTRGVSLPADYLHFMAKSDGGEGDVGARWIELWSVEEIAVAASADARYAGVLLFAGDGANTIYGFDAKRGHIVEGDWIGLSQDELVRHGSSFTGFLRGLAQPA